METINLIPQEERVQQVKTKVVKLSTILSIVVLVVVAAVGGFFYYKTRTLKEQINTLDNSVNTLRDDIGKLSDIEINARNLYSKSTILLSIFEERSYYSTLLEEFEKSIPDEVNVDSFGLNKDSSLAISGKALTYNAVQDFSNLLLERPIFTEVILNSVGLDEAEDKVGFFVVVSYDEALLNE